MSRSSWQERSHEKKGRIKSYGLVTGTPLLSELEVDFGLADIITQGECNSIFLRKIHKFRLLAGKVGGNMDGAK